VRRRDARTSIFHEQQQFCVLHDAGRDLNRSGRRRVLDGVLQQIRKRSLHLADIDADERQVCRDVATYDTACQQSSQPADGPVDDRRRVYQIQWIGRAPGAASELNKRLEKVRHSVGFDFNIGEQVPPRLGLPLDVGAT